MDKKETDSIPRPLLPAHFWIVLAGLANNIVKSFSSFTEELLEMAIYNARREDEVSSVWEDFTKNLEKLTEDQDGT